MAIPILGDLIDAVGGLVSEVVVDKDKKAEINFKLAELADKAEARVHEEILAQVEVNKAEAQHGSIFVAGWRPFVGWVSGVGVAYAAILQPLCSWVARVAGYTGDFPEIDTSLLLTVIAGMLGIGGMRSFEKTRGVSTNNFQGTPRVEAPPPAQKPAGSPPSKGRRFKL